MLHILRKKIKNVIIEKKYGMRVNRVFLNIMLIRNLILLILNSIEYGINTVFSKIVFHILKKKVSKVWGTKNICPVEFWIKIYTFFFYLITWELIEFQILLFLHLQSLDSCENNILKFQISSNIKISETYAFLPKLPSSISIIFFVHIGCTSANLQIAPLTSLQSQFPFSK